jgi:hypothetical protein
MRSRARRARHGRSIHTIGAHALTALDGAGIVDLLAWAQRRRRWGSKDHSAWAYALETGYQLPQVTWSPWLRTGIDRSSGDDDPFDRQHGTFFQMLPTARTYAQLPFFNLMNLQDVFASLILRPHEIVTVRSDYRLVSPKAPTSVFGRRRAERPHLGSRASAAGVPTAAWQRSRPSADVSATVAPTSWMTVRATTAMRSAERSPHDVRRKRYGLRIRRDDATLLTTASVPSVRT